MRCLGSSPTPSEVQRHLLSHQIGTLPIWWHCGRHLLVTTSVNVSYESFMEYSVIVCVCCGRLHLFCSLDPFDVRSDETWNVVSRSAASEETQPQTQFSNNQRYHGTLTLLMCVIEVRWSSCWPPPPNVPTFSLERNVPWIVTLHSN